MKDIEPGSGSSFEPGHRRRSLLFSAQTSAHGREPWWTAGTRPHVVDRDIAPGAPIHWASWRQAIVYFAASQPSVGTELWAVRCRGDDQLAIGERCDLGATPVRRARNSRSGCPLRASRRSPRATPRRTGRRRLGSTTSRPQAACICSRYNGAPGASDDPRGHDRRGNETFVPSAERAGERDHHGCPGDREHPRRRASGFRAGSLPSCRHALAGGRAGLGRQRRARSWWRAGAVSPATAKAVALNVTVVNPSDSATSGCTPFLLGREQPPASGRQHASNRHSLGVGGRIRISATARGLICTTISSST